MSKWIALLFILIAGLVSSCDLDPQSFGPTTQGHDETVAWFHTLTSNEKARLCDQFLIDSEQVTHDILEMLTEPYVDTGIEILGWNSNEEAYEDIHEIILKFCGP